jgi:hypothetical protein
MRHYRRRRREDDFITAAELACFAYCPEQWRLEYGLGLPPANRAALDAGTRHHEWKAVAERVRSYDKAVPFFTSRPTREDCRVPVEAKPLFRPDVLRPHLISFHLPGNVSAMRETFSRWAGLLWSAQAETLKEQELLPDFLTDFLCGILG